MKVNRDPDIEKYIIGSAGLSDVSVTHTHKLTYINNNWYKNSAGQGQLMPDDPRAIENPDITGEDITSELRSVHPTEYQYHFNNGGTNVTRYYFGGRTGASAETVVEPELGITSPCMPLMLKGTWMKILLARFPIVLKSAARLQRVNFGTTLCGLEHSL